MSDNSKEKEIGTLLEGADSTTTQKEDAPKGAPVSKGEKTKKSTTASKGEKAKKSAATSKSAVTGKGVNAAASVEAETKVSDSLIKIGQSYLKNNPAMNVVYVASDGVGFYERTDANNHASRLNNKSVETVKR